MDWGALGGAAVGSFVGQPAAGASIGSALFNKKKKASVSDINYPDYGSFANPQAGAASDQVYNFYSDRAKGKNVGYSPDDLSTMNAQAIDESTHEGNELTRRAGATQKARLAGSVGDMSTGSQDYLKTQSIGQTLASRSKAMRDVNISNAALKQQQIEQAGTGLQGYVNSEHEQQMMKYYAALEKAMGENNAAANVTKLNAADGANDAGSSAAIGAVLAKLAGGVGSLFTGKQKMFDSNGRPI